MRLYKVSSEDMDPRTAAQAEFVPHQYSGVYQLESGMGFERLCIGPTDKHGELILDMVELLSPPFFLLYVLYAPRINEAARYQSPQLEHDDILDFFASFYDFLTEDARHDLWVHSQSNNATIVWDHHDLIFVYGPLQRFEHILEQWGFGEEMPEIPVPHSHLFHPEYDEKENELIGYFKWIKSPLQPEDEQ